MARKVGFIGLGMMGNPMSKNLHKAGFELTVWNRTPLKMDEIVRLGAEPAGSAKEVAEKSDVTIPMPIAGLVRQVYAQAMADGRGEADYSAVAETEEKISKTVQKR